MLKNRWIRKWIRKADDALIVTGTLIVVLLIVGLGFVAVMYIISSIMQIAIAIGIIALSLLALGAGVMMLKKAFTKGV